MIDRAAELGVRGWVRNRRDGTVEALVQGERDAVERIVEWSRQGPPGARVTNVATASIAASSGIEQFVLRHTE